METMLLMIRKNSTISSIDLIKNTQVSLIKQLMPLSLKQKKFPEEKLNL